MSDLRKVRVERNPRVVYRDLSEDEGAVLLHLDTGAYHGVNAVGGAIWRLLEEDLDVEQLVERLRGMLSNAPPELGEEVWDFLQDLDRRDLVRIDRSFPPSDVGTGSNAGTPITNTAPVRDAGPGRVEAPRRSHQSRSRHAHP